jgi:predicted DNA-binding transcriptional regulator AlpA
MVAEQNSETFLNSVQVRNRYGVGRNWIERRTADSNFPRPTYFGPRRFWKIGQLIEWERAQASKTPGQPKSKSKRPARRAA